MVQAVLVLVCYLAFRRVLVWPILLGGSRACLQVEVVVLRHEGAILRLSKRHALGDGAALMRSLTPSGPPTFNGTRDLLGTVRHYPKGFRMSTTNDLKVFLQLTDNADDPERLEEDLRYLLDEVAALDNAEVDRSVGDPAPAGTRGGTGVQLGAALIALGGTGATLPMLVALVRDWLGRRGSGTIHLKIGEDEIWLDHMSTPAQREVLAEFLDRHRG